ncbi:MAG: peptide/nickel transport system permease protein [Gaiellaceae bacterium]|nr:peptide/nickel transport system permease protein [Gaiellaceae bacterium]
MLGFILKRLLYTVVVMIIASMAIFYALRVAPGDPVNALLNPTAMDQARQALRTRLGLDLPVYQQYFVYVKHIFQGDAGKSLLTGQTIPEMLSSYGVRSLVLAVTALVIAYGIAIPLGVLAAVRRNSIWDQTSMFLANLGLGIPSFWLALLLILLFGATLHWLPIQGSGDVKHLILPASVLAVESLAVTMRMMRSSMLEQLSQDYVRTLRAKGVRQRRIIWVHVVRNALIPIISLTGLRIGWLIGYAVIVETVFRWPGLGYQLVDSVIRRDYPVAQGLSLLLTFIVLWANFFANVAYALVDPRIRKR